MIPDALFGRLLTQLRRDEGWRLVPYTDSVGVLTLGCGHNLTYPISNAAVQQMLHDDVDVVWLALGERVWFQALDEVRQGAVVNMAFNLGMAGLLRFTHFLSALAGQNWTRAGAEMLDSTWAGQVGPRAHRLAEQIRSGAWQ